MFSPKSLIVSVLTFRSLIHFEFIFEYGVRECSPFLLFHCTCPVFPAPLIEEAVLSPLYILSFFIKHKVTISACVYLWVFYPVPWIYILFLCQYHNVLITVAWQYRLKSGSLIPPAPFFSFKIALAIRGLLCFRTNGDICGASSVKNASGGLIGIAINL